MIHWHIPIRFMLESWLLLWLLVWLIILIVYISPLFIISIHFIRAYKIWRRLNIGLLRSNSINLTHQRWFITPFAYLLPTINNISNGFTRLCSSLQTFNLILGQRPTVMLICNSRSQFTPFDTEWLGKSIPMSSISPSSFFWILTYF